MQKQLVDNFGRQMDYIRLQLQIDVIYVVNIVCLLMG